MPRSCRSRTLVLAVSAGMISAATAVVAPAPVAAAVIGVGCGASRAADLVAAVNAANATPATDTIVLAAGCTYTFSAAENNWYGPNALPAISSPITIEGNGSTIERDAAAPKFRLFFVGADATRAETLDYTTPGPGNLTLRNLTVRGGLARGGNTPRYGGGGAGMGGAIFNQGRLALAGVTLTANTAQGGSTGNVNGASTGGGGIGTDGAATGPATGGGFGPGTFGGAPGGNASPPSVSGGLAAGGGGGFRASDSGQDGAGASGGAGGGPATGTGGRGADSGSPGGVGGNGSGGGGAGGISVSGTGPSGGSFGSGGGGAGTLGAGGGGVGGGGGGGGGGDGFGSAGGGGFGGGGGGYGVNGFGGVAGFGGFGGGGGDAQFGSAGGGGFGGGAGGGGGGGGAGMGGAVFNHQGILTVVNSTLAVNTAVGGVSANAAEGQGLGGAIFNLNGTVTTDFTTIARNTAAQGGGGIYNLAYDSATGRSAALTLVRSIVSDSLGGATNVVNDLPANTTAGPNHALASATATVSVGSVVESPNSATVTGTPPLTGDPNLAAALAANGAPNRPQTLALQSPSPALDVAGSTCAPNVDQRAFVRPSGTACDFGAFEAGAGPFPALAPGDLVVIDHEAGTGARGALFSVNPTTGARVLRSDFGHPAQGPLGAQPFSVAVTSTGTVFVVDLHAGTASRGALFRVDPLSGDRVLLTDFGDASGPAGQDPVDLALGVGVIYVADLTAGANANGALFRIDPTTGARTVLAEFDGSGTDPAGVAVAHTGEVLVTDRGTFAVGGDPGRLFSVSPATGAKTVLSDFANPAQGPLGIDPAGVAVTPAGTIVVTDRSAGTGGRGQVVWVDPATGMRTLLDNLGTGAPLGLDPAGIALAGDGRVLTAHRQAGTSDRGQIVRLDPATGTRTSVSDFGSAAQGPTGLDPVGVAVVPQPLHAGDVWVADTDAGTGSRGALFRVDRTTGERALVSDFGAGANLGLNPTRVAISSAGTVLVADADGGSGNLGQLFSVNPTTGARTVLSDFNTGPNPGSFPFGVAVGPGGSILVADPHANSTGQLFRVDPQTGTRSVLSDFGSGANPGAFPAGVAVAPGGRALVADPNANGGTGALFSVDAVTGVRSIVTTFASGSDPQGVSVTADGTKALVADRSAGAGGPGALFSVDLATGARTLASDFGNPSQGPLGAEPQDVAATPATGTALVVDFNAGTGGGGGALFVVNTTTGARSLLSDFGSSVQGPTGLQPFGVAVVPVQQPNLLVVDPQAGGTQAGMVFRVDPVTGMRSVLADYARVPQGALGIDPYSAALTPSGRLWMTDISAGTGRLGGLFAADSLIGTRSLFSDLGVGANTTQNPTAVVRLPSGLLAVVDPTRGTAGKGAVYTVDPATGARALLSDFGNPAQGNGNLLGNEPMGATLDANGRLVVTDVRAGTGPKGALFAVDTTTGTRTLVHDFGAGGAPEGVGVRGVALGPAGQLLVADHGGQFAAGTLWSVDPLTGARSVAAANLGSDPFGVIVRADGTVYVIDDSAGTNGNGGVWRVPLGGGSATLVSDFGNPAQGPTGDAPIGGAAAASAARTVEPHKDKDKADKDKDGDSMSPGPPSRRVQAVIAGIHHGGGQPATDAGVRRLLDAMAYRAPEGTSVWAGGPVALGHGALATTPESVGEVQPVSNRDGTVHLVADARIDNRVALGHALGVRDALTDAGWILRAYETWGEECVSRLEGDFAFAVWDGPRRRLFGARDALGIKPFFYTSTAGTFRFATEPGALVGGPDGVAPEPNLELMARYVLNRFGDAEATLYRRVRRLPGGSTVTVDSSGLRIRTYWTPNTDVRHDDGDDCVEQFRDLFAQAVAARLRAVGPVGAYLSGGLDSSSIVATAKGQLVAFSLTFAGLPCDEREYIEPVIAASGARPTYIPYAEHREALDFGQIGGYHDVMYGVTQYLLRPLAQAAQARGVRSVLSGIGGDDILQPRRARRSRPRLARVRRSVWRSRPPVTRRWAGIGESGPPPHHLVAGRNTTLAIDGANRFAAVFGLEPRYPFLDRRLVDFTLGLPDELLRGGETKVALRRAMAGVLPEPVRTRAGKAEFSTVVDNELRAAQADAVESLVATARLVDLGVIDRARLRAAWDDYRAGSTSSVPRWTIQAVVGLELWHRTSIESRDQEVTYAGPANG